MDAPRESPPGATWVTTTTLLDRLNDFDDREAWVRFVDRFRRPITAFALKVGVPPRDAEDVSQESLIAFAEAFRAGKYDRERGRLRSWLFGIAYRQSLAQKRKSARHAPSAEKREPSNDNTSGAAHASRIWDQLWDRYLLEKALEAARDEFDPAIYRVFELVALEGRSSAEAADELGLTVKAVYNAKHRVAKRVREWIVNLDSPAVETDGAVPRPD